MSEQPIENRLEPEEPLVAADLAIVLRRLARAYDTGPLGNTRTAEGLETLAEFLKNLGKTPLSELDSPRPRRAKRVSTPDADTLKAMPIEAVRELLGQDRLSKNSLIELARARFGIAPGRLRRLSIEATSDAIRAALEHEESLNIIERNAEASGLSRRS